MKRQKEKRTRGIGSLSWAEREEMIKEYLSGNYSKVEIWKKYTGQSTEHGKILQWMRKLGYSDKIENPIKGQFELLALVQSTYVQLSGYTYFLISKRLQAISTSNFFPV